MRNRLIVRAILGASLSVFAAAGFANDFALTDLMSLLSQQTSNHSTFVEKKFIGILDKPLESSGELTYVAPNLIKKQTLKPKPELLILDGEKLSIERPDARRKTFNLQDHPEVSAFVTSIRATLSGDRSALESYYAVELTGSLEQWQLVLIPRQAQILKIIKQIDISGSHALIGAIEFEQADGDRSEMLITTDSESGDKQ